MNLHELSLAASAVLDFFYVHNGLVSVDSVRGAIELQNHFQELFARGGFHLCKWKSSEPEVLRDVDLSLLDP